MLTINAFTHLAGVLRVDYCVLDGLVKRLQRMDTLVNTSSTIKGKRMLHGLRKQSTKGSNFALSSPRPDCEQNPKPQGNPDGLFLIQVTIDQHIRAMFYLEANLDESLIALEVAEVCAIVEQVVATNLYDAEWGAK